MIDDLHAIDQDVFYEPDNALADFTFEDLPEYLYKRIKNLGWETPTPVQAKAIPYINAKRDIARLRTIIRENK